jgi:hypothetical protein
MAKIFSREYKKLVCGLAFVLFFCLTLQAPLMSYAMNGMDCKTKITCAAPPVDVFSTLLLLHHI